jgi:hypothetical protein
MDCTCFDERERGWNEGEEGRREAGREEDLSLERYLGQVRIGSTMEHSMLNTGFSSH